MNVSRKQKAKFRATRFAKHLARFVDRHRYPDFELTGYIVAAEAKRQSNGEGALSDAEREAIVPLRDAQRWKEVTLNGFIDELKEWSRNKWGWGYPLIAELQVAKDDWIMRKSLIEVSYPIRAFGRNKPLP